jgi:uncharacterized protein YuzE
MKITYDKEVDAVYIYFSTRIKTGTVDFTYPCDPIEVRGEINLDFDKSGKLLGIEVLDASKKLPEELIEIAERIDK